MSNTVNSYHGILCMDKPAGFTSFDVIGKLRGILQMKKLGHTGTLDPMATGVLPVLVGNATKACDLLPNGDKTYAVQVQFGMETDTLDTTGTVTASYPSMHVTRTALTQTISTFLGESLQVPPMYSAVSVGGKRLYQYAREGKAVERPARPIIVYTWTLEDWDATAQVAHMTISCGKGTYVRALVRDLGRALGGGATMTSLCRTAASGFTLSQCYTFAQVEQFVAEGTLSSKLLPIDTVFTMYPALLLSPKQTTLYKNGVRLALERLQLPEGLDQTHTTVRVYGADDTFLGLATAATAQGELRILKNF